MTGVNRKLFVQLRACATLGQVSYILYKKKKKSDEVRRRIVKTRHIHSIPLYIHRPAVQIIATVWFIIFIIYYNIIIWCHV